MRRTAPVLLTAALLLAGCSSSDDGGDAASSSQDAATSATSPAPVADAPVAGPDGSQIPVPAPVADKWRATGAETGPLGPARGPATEQGATRRVDFTGGSVFLTPSGRAFVVQGEILTTYDAEGGPAGPLGAPVSDEATTDGGWISVFEHGSIAFVGGHAEVTRT